MHNSRQRLFHIRCRGKQQVHFCRTEENKLFQLLPRSLGTFCVSTCKHFRSMTLSAGLPCKRPKTKCDSSITQAQFFVKTGTFFAVSPLRPPSNSVFGPPGPILRVQWSRFVCDHSMRQGENGTQLAASCTGTTQKIKIS